MALHLEHKDALLILPNSLKRAHLHPKEHKIIPIPNAKPQQPNKTKLIKKSELNNNLNNKQQTNLNPQSKPPHKSSVTP